MLLITLFLNKNVLNNIKLKQFFESNDLKNQNKKYLKQKITNKN